MVHSSTALRARPHFPLPASMSSLRRPPIECLFVSLFILFLFLFVVCRSETSFTGLVTQGHRSFGLEEGARRARRRRTRWRQAMTSLSRGAMSSTEGSAQPSTTLEVSSSHPRVSSFGHSRSPRSLMPEFPLVSSPVRPPSSSREVGTLSDSALEPSSRCPAADHEPTVLGSVRGLGFGVSPRALVSVRERTRS